MPTPRQVDQWLVQALADIDAAEARPDGISENHRRFWVQQSCEKAIKAWGMMKWKPEPADEGTFRKVFLRRHSPFLSIDAASEETLKEPLPRSIHLLQRETRAFVNGLAYGAVIAKIDATTPEFDDTKVSYRYPFLYDGDYTAPRDYPDWDAYQGEWGEVCRSVRMLIREVRGELAIFRRAP